MKKFDFLKDKKEFSLPLKEKIVGYRNEFEIEGKLLLVTHYKNKIWDDYRVYLKEEVGWINRAQMFSQLLRKKIVYYFQEDQWNCFREVKDINYLEKLLDQKINSKWYKKTLFIGKP